MVAQFVSPVGFVAALKHQVQKARRQNVFLLHGIYFLYHVERRIGQFHTLLYPKKI